MTDNEDSQGGPGVRQVLQKHSQDAPWLDRRHWSEARQALSRWLSHVDPRIGVDHRLLVFLANKESPPDSQSTDDEAGDADSDSRCDYKEPGTTCPPSRALAPSPSCPRVSRHRVLPSILPPG